MKNTQTSLDPSKPIKSFYLLYSMLFMCMFLFSQTSLNAQDDQTQKSETEIIISGARFAGDLLRHWISEYTVANPHINFVVEDKGAAEFSEADIIIHGHQPEKPDADRSSLAFARYAILPIANVNSPFAKVYGEKGLKKSEVKQVFFFNPLDRIEEKPLKAEYNAYSRIQQASAPIVFAKTFGYEQDDLHGRLISGTDQHLIQAVTRDSLGVSYAPLPLIYNLASGVIKEGLVVIPLDADDNGKISTEEKSYNDLTAALKFISTGKTKIVPVSDLYFAIKKKDSSPEVNKFLTWVLSKGVDDLEEYGFIPLESKSVEKSLTLLAN